MSNLSYLAPRHETTFLFLKQVLYYSDLFSMKEKLFISGVRLT